MAGPGSPGAAAGTPVRFGRVVGIYAALAAAYFFSEFFRISHAVIAPDLMQELGMSAEGLGVLTSAFFLAFAAQQIPNGILFDRFGPRRTMPVMICVGAAGVLLFAVAPTVTTLSLARAVMGIGFAAVFMGSVLTLSRWVPPDRYSIAIAALFVAGSIGNIAATSPWAAFTEAVGWRWASAIMGLAAAAVAGLVYLVVRDAPPEHPYLDRKPEPLLATIRGIGEAIRIPEFRYIFAMQLVIYMVTITVLAMVGPPFLHDRYGLNAVERGHVLLLMSAAYAVGSIVVGPLDRWLDTRKHIVTVVASAAATIHLILAAVPGLSLAAVTVLFALLGAFGGGTVVNLAHARAVFPDRIAGRGMVMMALGAFGGAAIAQIATGFILGAFPLEEGGRVPEVAYRTAFGFIAACTFLVVVYHRRVSDVRPSAPRVH